MTRRPLRIALLHPVYWPEVRRGSERLVHDLSVTLADRGHEVTLMTSHAGATATMVEEGVRVVRSRRLPEPRQLRWYEQHLANAPNIWRGLARERYDVAHAFFPADAWAALRLRRFGGPPVAFSFHGIPVRRYLVGRRYRTELLRSVVAEAAATTVLSRAAARRFRRYLLVEPEVLPGGVLTQCFGGQFAPRRAEPTLICAASLGDPYKRGELLISAFSRLRERLPGARLVLVRSRDPFFGPQASVLPEGVEVIEADETPALARAYASAWASVLPSVDDAFGLVLLESLAAGTPVVASRSGGPAEIVNDDSLGRLFEPDDEDDLVRAMEEALELGSRGSCAACSRRAAEFDWATVADRYEELYARIHAGGSGS